jgi:hypothetical protein
LQCLFTSVLSFFFTLVRGEERRGEERRGEERRGEERMDRA